MNPTCDIAASPGPAPGAPTLECALCGARFMPAGEICAGCPLSRGCELARCPNCGYQFPRGSRILDWIRRRLSRMRGCP